MADADRTAWKADIDALVFVPNGHEGVCAVHRLAFRTLLCRMPQPADCQAFFRAHEGAFQSAAGIKLRRRKLAGGANFHLTSRDIARELEKRFGK